MSAAVLSVYVVYENPLDFPGCFVLRRQRVVRGSLEPVPDPLPLAVGRSLADVRAALPPGLTRLSRHPADAPIIVEVWL